MPGPGRKEQRSLRIRAEITPGTPTAPRFLFRGLVDGIDDQRDPVIREEQIGIFGGSDDSYIPKLMAELPIPETEATFEQLPSFLMMCGLGTSGGGNRAGSAQGASGSSVVFTLPVPARTAPVTYSYTCETGDSEDPGGANGWAEVMEYALCKELTLTFNGGEGMKMQATLFGRQGTATNALGTFSNAGTLVLVETILSSRGSFWLTPVSIGSTFGTGQVTAGNILAGEIKITPKWTPKHPVDAGVLYFHTAVFTGIDIEGELTLENQISGTYGAAGSAGQKEKWRAQESQLLQARWNGGAIAEGTTYTSKALVVQLPMKWTKFEPLDDQDGNDIVVGKFVSKFIDDAIPSIGRGTVIVARLGTSEFDGAN